jgi:hypothetical protein
MLWSEIMEKRSEIRERRRKKLELNFDADDTLMALRIANYLKEKFGGKA